MPVHGHRAPGEGGLRGPDCAHTTLRARTTHTCGAWPPSWTNCACCRATSTRFVGRMRRPTRRSKRPKHATYCPEIRPSAGVRTAVATVARVVATLESLASLDDPDSVVRLCDQHSQVTRVDGRSHRSMAAAELNKMLWDARQSNRGRTGSALSNSSGRRGPCSGRSVSFPSVCSDRAVACRLSVACQRLEREPTPRSVNTPRFSSTWFISHRGSSHPDRATVCAARRSRLLPTLMRADGNTYECSVVDNAEAPSVLCRMWQRRIIHWHHVFRVMWPQTYKSRASEPQPNAVQGSRRDVAVSWRTLKVYQSVVTLHH